MAVWDAANNNDCNHLTVEYMLSNGADPNAACTLVGGTHPHHPFHKQRIISYTINAYITGRKLSSALGVLFGGLDQYKTFTEA